MKPYKQLQRGFTLIELLISTALLSLVLFIASYSYSLFSNRWQSELGNYQETAAFVKNVELSRRVLQSTIPLVISKADSKKGLYFVGGADSILAVSQYGVFGDEGVIYRLSIEKSPENPQVKQLVYREVNANSIVLSEPNQSFQFTHKIVVIDNVTDAEFQYFGWATLNDKTVQMSGIGKADKSWHKTYDAVRTGLFPEAARLVVRYQAKDARVVSISFNASYASHPERGLEIPGQ
ncbi:prepilin-type N-terminal cleavage/methylation domain-containing protein [Shewanella sp. Scap07]|uniref:PulJ/GspJ family protein n=1 Tax=Shewanella sp. Scap07 TaxID=2589987 RepID=UPI0015BF60FB|nr:prepilin-type N-terminal cleavage/methylation domain-containing protein [Shewanella sp. Scap07]QLE86112.1 prepilin-type N-terminal cleavage/methylation domain-containing protein [Shewanella sp. Scap07]